MLQSTGHAGERCRPHYPAGCTPAVALRRPCPAAARQPLSVAARLPCCVPNKAPFCSPALSGLHMIHSCVASLLQGATELIPRIAACLAALPGAAVQHGARFESACVRLTDALQQLMQLPALEEAHRAQLSSGVKALLEVVVERGSRGREVEQGVPQKEEGKDGSIAGLRRALLHQSQTQVGSPS